MSHPEQKNIYTQKPSWITNFNSANRLALELSNLGQPQVSPNRFLQLLKKMKLSDPGFDSLASQSILLQFHFQRRIGNPTKKIKTRTGETIYNWDIILSSDFGEQGFRLTLSTGVELIESRSYVFFEKIDQKSPPPDSSNSQPSLF